MKSEKENRNHIRVTNLLNYLKDRTNDEIAFRKSPRNK